MTFNAARSKVFNRGRAPSAFLAELVTWGKSADESIFAPNDANDIYTQAKPELGPWESLTHRRAAMLEVMRVLAGFESSWDWREGIDSTRAAATTAQNAEAGAWQVSYDSRLFGADLRQLLTVHGIEDGRHFQAAMKQNHALAMEYVARLMRHTTKHNGPLYRARGIFPPSLQGPEHAIYPWLNRDAVTEFRINLES